MFDHRNNPRSTYVYHSGDGFLLCSKRRRRSGERSNLSHYVFNPTTRQFAIIPPPTDDAKCYYVINQNPDDLDMGIVFPDMSRDQSTDKSIVVNTMEKGCPKRFVKYCLHMNAAVMAYLEVTKGKDPSELPFSSEKGLFDLLLFIQGNDEEGPFLVMRIAGEIISFNCTETKDYLLGDFDFRGFQISGDGDISDPFIASLTS
ncbi:unnamed protein product [Dovyalis caffra]|uniref:Uncharacterized protein n=1 Tax=Dovyalis caffra TaxID=77055 RepID=A0AAV1RS92_9ROSI|nr:unnamed protein product [Dovyalis caffra]